MLQKATRTEKDGKNRYFAKQVVVDTFENTSFGVRFFALVYTVSVFFYEHSFYFYYELCGTYRNTAATL